MDFLRLGFNRDALSNYIGKTEVPFVKTWSSEAYIERFVAKVESNSINASVVRFSQYEDKNNVFVACGTETGGLFYGKVEDCLRNGLESLTRVKLCVHAISDLHFDRNEKSIYALNMVGDVFEVEMERMVVRRRRIGGDQKEAFAGHTTESECYAITDSSNGSLNLLDVRSSENRISLLAFAQRRYTLAAFRVLSSPRRPRTPTTPQSPRTPRALNARTPNTTHSRTPNSKTPNSKTPEKNAGPPIQTCVRHIDEKMFAVGYRTAESGINVWDLRYAKNDSPLHVYKVPPTRPLDTFGVSSLNLNRSKTKLYALCTNGHIQEYSTIPLYCPGKAGFYPIKSYSGAVRSDFRIEFGISPFTDHIVCGTDNGAGIWDLNAKPDEKKGIVPKYGLKYISDKMLSSDWSENGRYIVGITLSGLEPTFVLYDNLASASESLESGLPQTHSNPYLLK